MTPELDAIGKSRLGNRARMCNGWRYMPGMLLTDGTRLCSYNGRLEWTGIHDGSKVRVGGGIPDLTDPATLGCLLALVREAYGSPALYCRLSSTTRASDGLRAWEVIGWLDASRSPNGRGGSFLGWGYASEAEALVATLEAAP